MSFFFGKNTGVSMMGEFTSSMPTQAALQALDDFVTCAITM